MLYSAHRPSTRRLHTGLQQQAACYRPVARRPSLDGTYDSDLRNSLLPQSVNTLIFLNKNSDM